MPTRIKISTNQQALLSDVNSIFGGLCMLSNFIGKGLSKFYHILAVSLFYDKVRKNRVTKLQEFISCSNPRINRSFVSSIGCPSCLSGVNSLKISGEPFNENFIGAVYFKKATMMLRNFTVIFSISLSYIKTTFSIYNSSQVSQLNRLIGSWNEIWRSAVVFLRSFCIKFLSFIIIR